jgi:serralysin
MSISVDKKNNQNVLYACLSVNPFRKITENQLGSTKALRAAFQNNTMWDNGKTIKVGFIKESYERIIQRYPNSTPPDTQTTDSEYTNEKANWVQTVIQKYIVPIVGISFAWDIPLNQSDIRISFTQNLGAFSMIGKGALNIEKDQPTMNLGWLDTLEDSTGKPTAGWGSVVVHEFCHALGMVHEHSREDASLNWNKQLIYDDLKKPPNNWDKDDVDGNIFNVISLTALTNHSNYDKYSIMHYIFPSDYFSPPVTLPVNIQLSTLDKEWLNKVYSGGRLVDAGVGPIDDQVSQILGIQITEKMVYLILIVIFIISFISFIYKLATKKTQNKK